MVSLMTGSIREMNVRDLVEVLSCDREVDDVTSIDDPLRLNLMLEGLSNLEERVLRGKLRKLELVGLLLLFSSIEFT